MKILTITQQGVVAKIASHYEIYLDVIYLHVPKHTYFNSNKKYSGAHYVWMNMAISMMLSESKVRAFFINCIKMCVYF